jgi:two-component system nitrate/nitrite response regulator NarL
MFRKIVICDDHIVFTSGISALLTEHNADYEVVRFNQAERCKTYLKEHAVDVFICDLNINNTDGFLLLSELKAELVKTKTIILTAYYEDFLIEKARKLGIDAFLKKETTVEELIGVIDSKKGKSFYTNNKSTAKNSAYHALDEPFVNKFRISKQEKEVIRLIIQGHTSKEIAEILFITKTTVDTHRKNIHKKLEISNSSSLIKFAHENNLFP